MLHWVGWFWIALVETLILLGIVGLVVWIIRSDTTSPRPPRRTGVTQGRSLTEPNSEHFSVVADIGHVTGEVHIDFDRRVTGIAFSPPKARDVARILGEAADCAEGHVSLMPPTEQKVRPSAWDRIKND